MKKKGFTKLISIVLCFSIVFYGVFVFEAPKAKAWPAAIANLFPEGFMTIGTWADFFTKIARWALDKVGQGLVVTAKMAALLAVQKATQALIGSNSNDGDTVIHDFGNYLYTNPQQRAMVQLNLFFNTASKGRLSSANYEGVGPNHDAYLADQAKKSVAGETVRTDIQTQAPDTSRLFSGGNMKAVTKYMDCGNNPSCYTLTAQSVYGKSFQKSQDVARSEQQNGLIPKKVNGRITSPAMLAQNALMQTDQLGTQIIMNADAKDISGVPSALLQIAQGAAMSIATRAANYAISDDKGKQAIKNKNDQFPFSVSYSATSGTGTGINAGGITQQSAGGAAAGLGKTQVGNKCGAGGFVIDPKGQPIMVNGQKQPCTPTSTPCAQAGGSCMEVSCSSGTQLNNASGCTNSQVCCK